MLDSVYEILLVADLEVRLPAFAGQVEPVHCAGLVVVEKSRFVLADAGAACAENIVLSIFRHGFELGISHVDDLSADHEFDGKTIALQCVFLWKCA